MFTEQGHGQLMKLSTALDEVYRAAVPDPARKKKANRIRQDLVRRLEHHVPHRGNISPTGSAKRKTDIAPIDDVDLFIELKPDGYAKGDGPRALLRSLKKSIEAAYGTGGVSIRTQPRSIRVDVPGCPVPFDLVPGLLAARGYEIPDTERDAWIRTDPRVHLRRLAEADQRVGGDLRTLIRLVKVWRARSAKALGTFHLEVLCWSVPTLPSGRVEALTALFEHLAVAIRSVTRDPGGVDGPALDRHLGPEDRQVLAARFTEAVHALHAAQLDERRAFVDKGHRRLRHLFGPAYPTI